MRCGRGASARETTVGASDRERERRPPQTGATWGGPRGAQCRGGQKGPVRVDGGHCSRSNSSLPVRERNAGGHGTWKWAKWRMVVRRGGAPGLRAADEARSTKSQVALPLTQACPAKATRPGDGVSEWTGARPLAGGQANGGLDAVRIVARPVGPVCLPAFLRARCNCWDAQRWRLSRFAVEVPTVPHN